MIQIEFRPEELHYQRVQGQGIRESRAEVLETNFFNLPVRFRIAGVELFEKAAQDSTVFVCQVEQEMLESSLNLEMSSPWSSVPILHLATVGCQLVRKACRGETALYNFPGGGYLRFHPEGETVDIFSSISQRLVKVSCPELLKAFEDFKESTRQYLMNEIPELVDHPAWSTWFVQ